VVSLKSNLKCGGLLAPLIVALAGCGGTDPQPTMMGAGADPLSGGAMPNGSLGTGAAKGNVAKREPDLGVDATLNGFEPFDSRSAWNKKVDKAKVDPDSDKIIAKIGKDKPLVVQFGAAGKDEKPFGIPYTVVAGDAPRVAVAFTSKDADAGPYPFPQMMPIEPGTAAHAIVIDRDGLKAYETSGTQVDGAGFKATSGAVWDLRSDNPRKTGVMSADPSGLPVFVGLVRYDEVNDAKEIDHALRITLSEVSKGYVAPATRSVGTSDDKDLPPMGIHLRLKKSFKESSKYSPAVKVILAAMKKYGVIVSDTGATLGLSGTPDLHWNDKDLAALSDVKADDFEVVTMGPVQGIKTADADKTATAAPATTAGKS
jgi:hypothetical protein